eukprot:gene23156-30362_t
MLGSGHSCSNKKVWKALDADPRVEAFYLGPSCKAYRLVASLPDMPAEDKDWGLDNVWGAHPHDSHRDRNGTYLLSNMPDNDASERGFLPRETNLPPYSPLRDMGRHAHTNMPANGGDWGQLENNQSLPPGLPPYAPLVWYRTDDRLHTGPHAHTNMPANDNDRSLPLYDSHRGRDHSLHTNMPDNYASDRDMVTGSTFGSETEYEMSMCSRALKPIFFADNLSAGNESEDRITVSGDDGDLETLLAVMPARLQDAVWPHSQGPSPLMEVAVDEGRGVVLRFVDGTRLVLDGVQVSISEAMECLMEKKHGSSRQERQHVGARMETRARAQGGGSRGEAEEEPSRLPFDQPVGPTLSDPFSSDGRMGVAGTLHRICGIRNREGRVYGLTYRISRHMPGIANIFMDILTSMCSKASWGRQDDPAEGYITPAGGCEGVAPHPCIGGARRFMVPHRAQQHATMIEAVQNHTPHVLIVDEIGTAKEVSAVNDIAQRGVLMELGNNKWRVHLDLAESVDLMLTDLTQGAASSKAVSTHTEIRQYRNGKMVVSFESKLAAERAAPTDNSHFGYF